MSKIKLEELKVSSFISSPEKLNGGRVFTEDILQSPDCMYTDTGNCYEP